MILSTRDFSNLREFRVLGFSAYVSTIPSTAFHPVGRVVGAYEVTIYYIPAVDEAVDYDWIETNFGDTASEFEKRIKDAFQQYLSPVFGGSEMREGVLVNLGVPFRDPNLLGVFELEGYAPFFQIQEIEIDRRVDSIFVFGRCEIDDNLIEHQVSIELRDGTAVFSYDE